MKSRANKPSQIKRRLNREIKRLEAKRIVLLNDDQPRPEKRDAATQVVGQFECGGCRRWVRRLFVCQECSQQQQFQPQQQQFQPHQQQFKPQQPFTNIQKRRYRENNENYREKVYNKWRKESRVKRQAEIERSRRQVAILHERHVQEDFESLNEESFPSIE
jgi:hypothetical protein